MRRINGLRGRATRGGRAVAFCALCLSVAGCGLITFDMPAGPVDGNRDPTLSSMTGRTSGEPNDDFDESLLAVFDTRGRARLQGVIATADDVDVFDLGPLRAGDRIIVDLDTGGLRSRLDSMVGLFDANLNLFADNDDTALSLDSFIDEIVRHDSEVYYLVVSRSAFSDSSGRSGAYRVDVEVISGHDVPPPRGQTVFLDFEGGRVDADNLGLAVVPPFDGGAINQRYEGETDIIKSSIVRTFAENFAGVNVTVTTSDDAELPEPPFTTVMFGGFSPPGLDAFAVSERVDQFNRDAEEVAIIFTETFVPYVFSRPPTSDELGVAIGNIAAHEVGHLLGLNHVEDETALMDAVSPADAFLLDQEFRRAPLFAPELFPIGFQDALLLLSEIVGVF